MITIIDAVMDYLNNHFHRRDANGNVIAERGEFSVADNTISRVSGAYIPGQYIRIMGSALNDGAYRVDAANNGSIQVSHTERGLADEVFIGAIITLAIPREVSDLVREIEQFQAVAASGTTTGIVSESIGSYSYTRATGNSGMPATWSEVFEARLKKYRRMFPEVV